MEARSESIHPPKKKKTNTSSIDTQIKKDIEKNGDVGNIYVTEVPLKGSAEKHYKRWRNENHLFPDAVGHHIQGITIHDGEWDSHGAIKIWNYTIDGKEEVFKERREIDDENMAVTFRGLEGHVMEQLKVNDIIFQFIQKSPDETICKITSIWEKHHDDMPEPSNYMKFAKSLAADMDDHILKA